MESNDEAGITLAQPRLGTERTAVAQRCCSTLEISMPLLVDAMDDRVGHAYSGMPDRLYVLDRDLRVAYKSGRGPFGFKTGEMEQALIMLLLDQRAVPVRTAHGLPLLDNAAAWKKLPRAEQGGGRPLPGWARALAGPLPRTTAAMLELDFLHRAHSPLDPKLRAKMRWVAARANRCAYSEACAAADLCRAGVDEAGQGALAGDFAALPPAEALALSFARKMTLAADTITDAEMAQLLGQYGNERVVAMVLLLAYANFQDRLILTLGLAPEKDGSPPLPVRFARPAAAGDAAAPPRPAPRGKAPSQTTRGPADPEWRALDFGRLQEQMAEQRARQPRIRVPTWDEVCRHLPAGYAANRPLRIRWSLVCLGYQPELAAGWSACMRTFAEEAQQDRVFEESLFWVVTRALHCFY